MNCAERESMWDEHQTLLKKFRRGEATIDEVFTSAKKLPARCSNDERNAEKTGRAHANAEKEMLSKITAPVVQQAQRPATTI